MVERASVQGLLDRVAVSASVLCMLHCLATPLLLLAVPLLSSTLLADEAFHRFLVLFVLPVSLVALLMGCRRHKDGIVFVASVLGLGLLVTTAYLGHDLLGEAGEKVATVVGGMILAVGHVRNYQLCRGDGCDR